MLKKRHIIGILLVLLLAAIFVFIIFGTPMPMKMAASAPSEFGELEQVKNYVAAGCVATLLASILIWALFAFLIYRFFYIDSYKAVRDKGRLPWTIGLIVILVLVFIANILTSFINARNKWEASWVLVFSSLTALAGVVLYWIWSVIYWPVRFKYAPLFRRQILRLFQRSRNA